MFKDKLAFEWEVQNRCQALPDRIDISLINVHLEIRRNFSLNRNGLNYSEENDSYQREHGKAFKSFQSDVQIMKK